MPTKTQRILSYLPPTFRPDARDSVLRRLVDTFGVELQGAENSLAAVMAAHWVDHADRGAERIDDLALMAALYNLLPRDDESVEEFREHLKTYVRTFIEGTVTVQGLLRVSAEALNLHIADEYESASANHLDTWWAPTSSVKAEYESRIDDAAIVVFGFHAAAAQGDATSSATVTGSGEIPATMDSRQHRFVNLTVDAATTTIDLQQGGPNPARITREEVVKTMNQAFAPHVVAALVDVVENGLTRRAVEITSPTTGVESRVAVAPLPLHAPTIVEGRFVSRAMVTDEAAQSILGFVKRESSGTPAESFVLETDLDTDKSLDLTRGRDLREQNLLNISVDGAPAFQVDCAGDRPRATLIQEVVDKINDAAATQGLPPIAFAVGRGIQLTSPTQGAEGRIELRPTEPPQRNAIDLLFGAAPKQTAGIAAAPATIVGDKSILRTVDLSQRPKLRLSVNRSVPVDINVAGTRPAETSLDEVIDAINAVYPNMASRTDQDQLKLSVPAGETATRLAVLPLRHIDLIEYPHAAKTQFVEIPDRDDGAPRHGDSWDIENSGICEVFSSISIESPSGTFGPAIVNHTLGFIARIMSVVDIGERVSLSADASGKLLATHFKKNEDDVLVPEEVDVTVTRLDDRGAKPDSQTVRPYATILTLPRGKSRWSYADCYASRFDLARFASKDATSGARFAGGLCRDRGIIDASPFENAAGTAPPENIATVFASEVSAEPGVNVRFDWCSCDAGAVIVNLPADLSDRFGGRFNVARFGKARGQDSSGNKAISNGGSANRNFIKSAVTEPAEAPNSLLQLIPSVGSTDVEDVLVTSSEIPIVPIGFEATRLPFRKPKFLTGGAESTPARLYLSEAGRPGFILLEAREAGTWGNQIYVTAHQSGPAMYDVEISFDGARFESARSIVRGEPLKAANRSILQPGKVGVLQAKAAGIRADVTRNRAQLSNSNRKFKP